MVGKHTLPNSALPSLLRCSQRHTHNTIQCNNRIQKKLQSQCKMSSKCFSQHPSPQDKGKSPTAIWVPPTLFQGGGSVRLRALSWISQPPKTPLPSIADLPSGLLHTNPSRLNVLEISLSTTTTDESQAHLRYKHSEVRQLLFAECTAGARDTGLPCWLGGKESVC